MPAENLLGEVGGGWQVAMTTLLHERGRSASRCRRHSRCRSASSWPFARDRGADPLQRDRIAREWIEMQAVLHERARALGAREDGLPAPRGSISKLVWSEANQA